jgi:hypothetical protein
MNEDIHYIDSLIEYLQHPFYMMIGGLIFYFVLKFSVMRNFHMIPDQGFWSDQKDEMGVAIIGGLLFVVWDDEILTAYYHYKEIIVDDPVAADWMYFYVGVATENIYTGISWIVRLKNKIKKYKIVEDNDERKN